MRIQLAGFFESAQQIQRILEALGVAELVSLLDGFDSSDSEQVNRHLMVDGLDLLDAFDFAIS